MRREKIAIAVLAVAAVVGGCGNSGGGPPGDGAPLAGISKEIDPELVPLAAGELPDEPAARDLRRRCAGCHDVPGPRTDPQEGWSRVLDRMEDHIEDAGLLPLADEEKHAILEMLRRTRPKDTG